MCWGRGESLLLDLWGSGTPAVLVNGLLGLGRGLLGVSLDSLHGVSSMLVSKTLDLLGLLVGNVVALLQLSINDLLVLDVDEGTEEGNECRDQSQAPERDELDEEVGDEGSKEHLREREISHHVRCGRRGYTYSDSDVDILGEHDTLRLNNEEVDELLKVVGHALKRSLGNGVVLARPELRSKTTSESHFTDNLSGCRKSEYHVGHLEHVADQVQVSGGEDEEDGRTKRYSGSAGVLPAQQAVEHAVVVWCMLAM